MNLETISPISEEKNPHGGSRAMVKYNLCDVKALAQRLQAGPSGAAPSASAVELVEPNGPKILHSKAKERYSVGAHMLMRENDVNPLFSLQLTSEQLKGIKPVSIKSNPHGGPYPMKHYNLCDVEQLATRLGRSAQAPSTPKRKRVSVAPWSTSRRSKGKTADGYGLGYDYSEGAFDGMSADDAYYAREQPPLITSSRPFIDWLYTIQSWVFFMAERS